MVECVHTPGPRGPISDPLLVGEPPAVGGGPLTGHRAAQNAAGTHRGSKGHVHHSSPAVGHLGNCPEDVFSGPRGGPPSSRGVVVSGR